VRKGPSEWLKSKLASGFDGLVTRVTASLPPGAVEELTTVFGPLVERAGKIATALGSGDCKPLLQGIEDLKSFVAEWRARHGTSLWDCCVRWANSSPISGTAQARPPWIGCASLRAHCGTRSRIWD